MLPRGLWRHFLTFLYMNLYNKNILEYAQIARNGTESEISYIESHSNV